ncbi:Holliday junction resolvase RuvX [Iamia sp. SCSIO 61187]|uniref:Holliday junction resolvase RuvX n=1 Tax=Iamia sp. SCSIO 61187 TaxID=2722752 RepID=UPI001C634BB4|nr:Holliday junction resolvase RuvX [Iamia sp. SCSIO 61187]
MDWGTVRIGLATCDPEGILASPYGTIDQVRDLPAVRRRIARIVADEEVEVVVVGHPLSLDGSRGPAARSVEAQAAALAEALDVPVVLHDERLTTVTAHRLLAASGVDGRQRRRVVDRAAAAVLLQTWLDGGAPTHVTPASLGPPEE